MFETTVNIFSTYPAHYSTCADIKVKPSTSPAERLWTARSAGFSIRRSEPRFLSFAFAHVFAFFCLPIPAAVRAVVDPPLFVFTHTFTSFCSTWGARARGLALGVTLADAQMKKSISNPTTIVRRCLVIAASLLALRWTQAPVDSSLRCCRARATGRAVSKPNRSSRCTSQASRYCKRQSRIAGVRRTTRSPAELGYRRRDASRLRGNRSPSERRDSDGCRKRNR
jgi:hypothetical protein